MAPVNKKRQVNEIVRCGKDPSYFMNKYVKIQHPQRGTIAFKTYDFQDDCLKDLVTDLLLKQFQPQKMLVDLKPYLCSS
jgi:hypothetical protein